MTTGNFNDNPTMKLYKEGLIVQGENKRTTKGEDIPINYESIKEIAEGILSKIKLDDEVDENYDEQNHTLTIKTTEGIKEYESILEKALQSPIEPTVLRCGTFLSDDNFYDEAEQPVRIRIINYDDKIYYHKMIAGECVSFRLLSK